MTLIGFVINLPGCILSIVAVIILSILLSPSSIEPVGLQMVIRDNCKIEFLPNNSLPTTDDAFSFEDKQRAALDRKCNATWIAEVAELSTVTLITEQPKRAVAQLKQIERHKKQQLKIVVFFGYKSEPNLTLAEFCSLLEDIELNEQCFTDTYDRIIHHRNFEKIEVLTFWFYLVRSGSHIAQDFLTHSNKSKNSLVARIADDMQKTRRDSNQIGTQFLGLKNEVVKYFLPDSIDLYFDNGYEVRNLTIYVRTMKKENPSCFAGNQIFLQMKSHNQLDSNDALELRVWSQYIKGYDSNEDQKLCDQVIRALLEHATAHAKLFIKLFDEKKYEKLRQNKLTVAVLDQLVDARYGNKTKELIDFIWNGGRLSLTACIGSLALVTKMQKFGTLASFGALALFSRVKLHQTTDLKSCKSVIDMAPDLINRCHIKVNQCDGCNSSTCQSSTFDYLHSILGNISINLFEEYPFEVLFVGYVLHSMKTSNVTQINSHQISSLDDTDFQEQFNHVLARAVSIYLQQSEILYFNLPGLETFFNKETYAFVLSQVIPVAYKEGGITKLDTFMYRSEEVKDIDLKCESFDVLYKQMEQNAQLDTFPALFLWLFIDGYILPKKPNLKCEEVEMKLRNSTRERLEDYFLLVDSKNISQIVKWHNEFEFGSPWVLPKLVKRACAQNKVSKVIEFFKELSKGWEDLKKLDLCGGLVTLVEESNNCNNSLSIKTIKKEVKRLLPPKVDSHVPLSQVEETLHHKCWRVYENLKNNF